MKSAIDSFRYEKKIFLENFQYPLLKYIVKTSSFNFYQPHASRWINNIYLDNYDFSAFHDNIEGNASRKKLRIRWYGQQFASNNSKVLELKIKQGHVGTKNYYNLGDFYIGRDSNSGSIMRQLKDCKLQEGIASSLKVMRPIISNRYHRDYYLSMDGKIRITIDRDISFNSWFSSGDKKSGLSLDSACILEVKFSKERDRKSVV